MTGGSITSSYMRVESDRTDSRSDPRIETVDVADGLLFVDVAEEHVGGWEGEVANQLRFVEESVLRGLTHVLIRPPGPVDNSFPDRIKIVSDLVERRSGHVPPIGAVHFVPGEQSTPVRWSAPVKDEASLLATARSVELAALMSAGKAHWRPKTFHYEAPSGEHRSDFIRVGDAIRSPRDAAVLATWLYPYIDTGTAVLVDTFTLLPIVMALQAAAAEAGMTLGPVAIRDAYPNSGLQDEQFVELTVGASGALALLSVSSTGRTARSLSEYLEKRVGESGVKWCLETLVHRTQTRAESWPDDDEPLSKPWLHIPNADSAADRESCERCRDREPYVRIDPTSFANTSLPEPPVVVMPDPPVRARKIDNLLEMYDDTDSIGIDCDPAARTRMRRRSRRWGVCFYPHRLLSHPRLIKALDEQLSLERDDSNDGRIDLDKLAGFDAIAAIDEDIDHDGFDEFVQWANTRLRDSSTEDAKVPVVRFASSPDDDDGESVAEQLRDASHILVMAVGTVTGGTVQEILIRIHRALSGCPAGSYVVSGLVLHARPSSYDEWRSMRSSFSNRLVAMWMTYLPSADHPLADEQRLFRQTLDDVALSPEASEYAQARRRWVLTSRQSEWPARREIWKPGSGTPNPASVLMCGDPDRDSEDLPRLLPNSLFGHRMSMLGTLVGVGAAMHRCRLEEGAKGGPPGLKFDLSRIPVVYFEVPIICAVLRWIRPFEASWERRGRTVDEVLLEIWHRTAFEEPGSQATLLAELALAAAAGKIPPHAKNTIARFFAEIEGTTEIDMAPLETAKQLLEAAWNPLPNREQHQPIPRQM